MVTFGYDLAIWVSDPFSRTDGHIISLPLSSLPTTYPNHLKKPCTQETVIIRAPQGSHPDEGECKRHQNGFDRTLGSVKLTLAPFAICFHVAALHWPLKVKECARGC
jgi:hypothetical protein